MIPSFWVQGQGFGTRGFGIMIRCAQILDLVAVEAKVSESPVDLQCPPDRFSTHLINV